MAKAHPVRLLRDYDVATVVVIDEGCDRESLLDLLLDGALGVVNGSWHAPTELKTKLRQLVLQLVQRGESDGARNNVEVSRHPGELPSVLTEIVVVGASTGGPRTLALMLRELTRCPVPIVIVQHIPAGFDVALVDRLDRLCPVPVRSVSSTGLLTREVVVVPSGKKVRLVHRGREIALVVEGGGNDNGPIDAVFASAALCSGKGVVAVVLTGMGQDGLSGVRSVRDHGGTVWVQDPDTAVIAGMPGAVLNAKIADAVASPQQIGRALVRIRPHSVAGDS